ncbi:MAG TPA: hypothetical protein VHA33_29155 [Candidatus Angelobacter sp.]|jgi:hypothetical protein|nr:hypothetical protein [Candidatus Angelobacter sp.]
MYRALIEVIPEDGLAEERERPAMAHEVWYCNGCRRGNLESVAYEVARMNYEQLQKYLKGWRPLPDAISWLDIWIEEWIRVRLTGEKDSPQIKSVSTVHLQERIRTAENIGSETYCGLKDS